MLLLGVFHVMDPIKSTRGVKTNLLTMFTEAVKSAGDRLEIGKSRS